MQTEGDIDEGKEWVWGVPKHTTPASGSHADSLGLRPAHSLQWSWLLALNRDTQPTSQLTADGEGGGGGLLQERVRGDVYQKV